MIDALLYAFRDAVRKANYGYDYRNCNIMDSGMPTPGCGDLFLAIHQLASTSDSDNCLNERFGFGVTLTARVQGVPLDRVGDSLLARELARKAGPGGSPSFNARIEQLRAFGHMCWGVIGDANTLMIQWLPDAATVYGFCEPPRYRGAEPPHLVGGDWFGADPAAGDVGLVSQLTFVEARRLQPIALFV